MNSVRSFFRVVMLYEGGNVIDPTVAVKFSRELTAAIMKAGGYAKYTEYPAGGHDSCTKAYDNVEMWAWLFAQRKSAVK